MAEKIKNRLRHLLTFAAITDNAIVAPLIVFLLNRLSVRKLTISKIVSLKTIGDRYLVKTIEGEKTGVSVGPRSINKASEIVDVAVPSLNIFKLEDAVINPYSSCFVLNRQLVADKVNPNERYNEGFVLSHGKRRAVIKKNELVSIDTGFFLCGNGTWNWYHWLIEVLPKIMFLKETGIDTLLISREVLAISSMKDVLNLWSGNLKIIPLDKDKNYQVNTLYYVNHVNYTTFNYFKNEKVKTEDSFFREAILRNYSNTIAGRMKPSPEGPKRIYLRRKDTRTAANEVQLFDLLKQFSFVAINPGVLTFEEQFNIIHQADYIVGVAGAAWTNLIFAKQGAKGLCFMDNTAENFSCFSNLAEIFGVDLIHLYYQGTGNISDHDKGGFEIELGNVMNVLNNWFPENNPIRNGGK